MKKYSDSVANTSGKAIPGATIAVYLNGTTTLASIFSDRYGAIAQTNPITADATGAFGFYCVDGRYDIYVSGANFGAKTVSDILLDDPFDPLTYTDTGILESFSTTATTYSQVIQQNLSNSTTASTNWNASNDAATAITNFIEMGINSSTYVGTGAFNKAGTGYIATASTDLAIGTYSLNAIHFVINNGATDAVTINTDGTLSSLQSTTAAAPAWRKGAIYFDTTLNKLRVGGAAGWETVTSV